MTASVEDFEPLLEDQHTTGRAYFLCVIGLVLFEALLQLPDLLRQYFPKGRILSRDAASHSVIRVYLHKVLTLPSPLQILTTHHFANILRLGIFIGLNILFGWNRIAYTTDYKVYGWLTIANAGLALVLSARANLLSVVFRVPSSALLIYHRWSGRAALVHATLHVGLTLDHHARTGQIEVVIQNTYIQGGLVAFSALALMGLTSVGPIRRYLFEFFYYPHFLFLVFVAGAIVHATPAPEFLVPGLTLWGCDRIWRLYQNARSTKIQSAEILAGNVLKVKVNGLKPTRPNQIAWVGTSIGSFLYGHPFTIASAPADGSGTFAIRGLGRDTRKLQDVAGEKTNQGPEENHASANMRLRFDGPYGYGSLRWEQYPIVVLVAGGIGITPAISIASHLLHQSSDQARTLKTRHIHLFWTIRESNHVSWFEEELGALSSVATQDTSLISLSVDIYVSNTSSPVETEASSSGEESKTYRGPGTIHSGRPSVFNLLQSVQQLQPGIDIAMSVCGPRSLLADGRRSAARLSTKTGLVFVEEEVFER